jgi:CheY-like chemotaxis protein
MMRFSISDTGRGMSEHQLARLFKPFEQTNVSTARTHGGTGLGLAISRELARLMGGELEVVSTEDKGSTFTLEIGLVEVAHAAPEEVEDIDQTRILVVDDHEVNRRAVALMLEPFGVLLTGAACGEDALELLAAQPFDVVLMDMNMPGMGGVEACQRLRAIPGPNQSTPVIAFTASSEAGDLAACEAAGMNGHVEKPIDAHMLHAAIAAALSDAEDDEDVHQPLPAIAG